MKKLFSLPLFLLASVLGFGQTLSYTPNMNLGLAPRGYPNWDVVMNQNFTAIDNLSLLKSGGTMTGQLVINPPAGTIAALLNAPITITTTITTQPAILLQGTNAAPTLGFFRTDAGTDLKHWALGSTVDGTVHLSMANDAGTTGADWMTCSRTGATPTGCTMNSALTISLNQPGVFEFNLFGVNTGPAIRFNQSNAGTDQTNWYLGTGAPNLGEFYLTMENDAGSSNTTVIGCTRTGATATGCTIVAPLTVGSGGNIVYRCTTAGTQVVGALTTTAANCGASVDTGLRVQ